MRSFSEFKATHQGADVIVCGCGPSLETFEAPAGAITIGVNDVGRRLQPDYLVVLNPPEQFSAGRYRYIRETRARAVFSQLELPLEHRAVTPIRLGRLGGTDLSDPTVLHYTRNSPYVAVCLAAHMGARRVGLVGVDFTGPHPLTRRLSEIDREYGALAEALTRRGVSLVNLSSQSRLTSLKRGRLEDFQRPERGGALKVTHIAITNCAGALWNLHALLRTHSSAQSRVITASPVTSGRRYPQDILLSDRAAARAAIAWADILHFHNYVDPRSPALRPFVDVTRDKPAVLQFHSEPSVVRPHFPGRDPRDAPGLPTLVVAQKQARFYPRAHPVPNAVDIYRPELMPATQGADEGPLRVLYTPTDTRDYPDPSATCQGKGYAQTRRALEQLTRDGLIRSTVETNLPWSDVMQLRRQCDAVIDECFTGGYHLTSLEALSQGLATLAWLDPETRALLCELTGSTDEGLPWQSARLEALEQTLAALAREPERLAEARSAGRRWMETFWSPEFVVQHYLARYGAVLEGSTRPPQQLAGVHYTLAGQPAPRRSEDFPQTVRLSPSLLKHRGSLRGRSCHILGSGPSVASLELSLLRDRTVFALNATVLLFDALGRPADYYCVSDRRFLSTPEGLQYARDARDATRVFAGYCDGFLPDADIQYLRIIGGDGISTDAVNGVYHGCTVALFAAQLALWLGCDDLWFHGCEFSYQRGRFQRDDSVRPHDTNTYPRIEANFRRLAEVVAAAGGRLRVVGPSKLVGDFQRAAVPGIERLSIEQATCLLRAGATDV